jgi:DNA polymerase-3 subunit epsilon
VASNRRNAEPPVGSVWDVPLPEAPLVFVDLEMTGLDEKRDRVLQVCLERVVGGCLQDRLMTYVDPEGTFGNAAIHGIGEAELAGAPRFAAVAPRLLAVLEGGIVVAHGASYDIAFLRTELARCGVAWDAPFHIDTLHLSRRAFNFKSHRLALVARELGIPCPAAHRADNDVEVLRAIFDRVVAVLEPTTPRDLWHVRTGLGHARPEVVAGLERARLEGTALRLRYRPAGRSVQEIPFHVTAMRTDLDPPMVIGYLSHTRGRRELRIDRILSLEPHAGSGSTP